MRLLALDFDGVISDSAPESFVVALRTYADLRPGSWVQGIRDRVAGLSATSVRADPVYLGFVEMMPLGNRAEDFGVVLSLLDRGSRAADQQSYAAAHAALGPQFLGPFHERFYLHRKRFRAEDEVRWAELLGPYPRFVEVLKRRGGEVPLALATAKDRESATFLLREFGLSDLIPDERVFDKEAGVDKQAHLRALSERTAIPFEEITFIDDKVNHLDSVARLGVRCVLAGWGYNARREWAEARARGHLVCTLEDVERQLFG